MQSAFEIVEALGGLDVIDGRAERAEGVSDVLEVVSECLADFGVDRGDTIVEGADGKRRGLFAVYKNFSYHFRRLTAEVCVIDAVADEGTVQREGVGACVMRHACFGKGLIDGELGGHDRVVGGGEDGVDSVRCEALGREEDFVVCRAGGFDVFEAFLVAEGFRRSDGCRGGVLTEVIEEADLLGFRVQREDEVHDGIGVEVVGGAGEVRAGVFHGLDDACADRVGDGREDDRDLVVFCRGLHGHGDRGGDADHEVYAVRAELRDDLVEDGVVRVAVVVVDVEFHALLGADLGEALFDVLNDLVEGGIVDVVADADRVFRGLELVGEDGGDEGSGEQGRCCAKGYQFFHNNSPLCGVDAFARVNRCAFALYRVKVYRGREDLSMGRGTTKYDRGSDPLSGEGNSQCG